MHESQPKETPNADNFAEKSRLLDGAFYHLKQPVPLISEVQSIETSESTQQEINLIRPFTMADLETVYGVTEASLQTEVEAVFNNLKMELTSTSSSNLHGEILLHIWQATRNLTSEAKPETVQLADDLSSITKLAVRIDLPQQDGRYPFLSSYLRTVTNGLNNYYLYRAFAAQSEAYVTVNRDKPKFIGLGKNRLGTAEFADQTIVDLAKDYYLDPTIKALCIKQEVSQTTEGKRLFHDTTTSAFESILADGTIYSGIELKRKSQLVLTGELGEGGTAYSSVYASSQGIDRGHAGKFYFNEELVTFVINEPRQEQYLRTKMQTAGLSAEEIEDRINQDFRRYPVQESFTEEMFETMTSAQRKEWSANFKKNLKKSDRTHSPQSYESFIGPEVPLSSVDAVAVSAHTFKASEEKIRLKYPHIKVLVREAAELVNLRRDVLE